MKISNINNVIITTQTSLEKSHLEANKLTRTINAINNIISIYYDKPMRNKKI
ncbi:hypothetical protein M2263_004441 [Providencia alcalifaciens]|nr:hypothetical protein [Providencia alcalifaciens]